MTLNEQGQSGQAAPEEREAELARLYRAGSVEEPPAHLEAAILAAARREVGAAPRSPALQAEDRVVSSLGAPARSTLRASGSGAPRLRLGPTLRACRLPLSIAAVIVLSASLVMLMSEEGGDRVAAVGPAAPLADRAPPQPPAAVAMSPGSRDQPGGQAVAQAPEVPAAPTPRAAAPPARAGASREEEAPAPGRTAVPFFGPGNERREADDAPGRSTAAEAKLEAAPIARADRRSEARPATGEAQPLPRSAEAPVEAPRARSKAASLSAERAPPVEPQKSVLLRELEREPPEKWRRRIEELREQGEQALADEVLAEFKRRFPDQPSLSPAR